MTRLPGIPYIFLSVEEEADRLGMSRTQTYVLARAHEIPAIRVGRRVVIIRPDPDAVPMQEETAA
jgi:excisionase family DNA binding protein